MATYGTRFYGGISAGSTSSASTVLPLVAGWLPPIHHAVDLGCGVGNWLGVLHDEMGVEDVVGVDGDYVPRDMLRIPLDSFIAHDLSATPFTSDRRFDLAMSIEVAEHLPEEAANGFVKSLVDLAPAVLFASAIPFQGGTGHVNEQWPSYWAEKFAAHDYLAFDVIRPEVWTDHTVAPCIAQNVVLFVHRDLAAEQPLADLAPTANLGELDRVHPGRYLLVADPEHMSVRYTLRKVPKLASGALRRYWQERRRS